MVEVKTYLKKIILPNYVGYYGRMILLYEVLVCDI